ncbi:unnamed protein product, partial [Mesorhabditis belari]|uniref:Uncharacterized protein n=1 Tax=Mesorhabditis belari TaxID=2138241 RepID=A0AAF3JAV0_9BILA
MQAFILFCGFLSVSLAFQCYVDENPNGEAPTSDQTAIDCADGCKYCAKITGKLKGSKDKGSLWGCGCGGEYDLPWVFGYKCTKKGTQSVKDDAGDKGKLYCCDKENVSLAFQCYIDLNRNGQAPTSAQAVIDCADGCKAQKTRSLCGDAAVEVMKKTSLVVITRARKRKQRM